MTGRRREGRAQATAPLPSDRSRVGLYKIDAGGRFEAWDHVLIRWTGLTDRDVVGRTVDQAFPDVAGLGWLQAHQAALRGAIVVRRNLRGRLHTYDLVKIEPCRAPNGEITGAVAVLWRREN